MRLLIVIDVETTEHSKSSVILLSVAQILVCFFLAFFAALYPHCYTYQTQYISFTFASHQQWGNLL